MTSCQEKKAVQFKIGDKVHLKSTDLPAAFTPMIVEDVGLYAGLVFCTWTSLEGKSYREVYPAVCLKYS